MDFVNNVVYNWGIKAIYGGEEGWFNVVKNYFRPGPATRHLDGEWLDISVSETTSMIPGNFHIQGNEYDIEAVKDGGYNGVKPDKLKIANRGHWYYHNSSPRAFPIKVEFLSEYAPYAYKAVLKHAGASKKRDAVDKRIVKEVRKGTARYKGSRSGYPGIIDSEEDVK